MSPKSLFDMLFTVFLRTIIAVFGGFIYFHMAHSKYANVPRIAKITTLADQKAESPS